MLVERLLRVVQSETEALDKHERLDLAAISRKKSNMLLELTRISRVWRADKKSVPLHHKLTELRDALNRNERALQIHLQAARQLTDVIAGVAREAESDGTYAGAYASGMVSQ